MADRMMERGQPGLALRAIGRADRLRRGTYEIARRREAAHIARGEADKAVRARVAGIHVKIKETVKARDLAGTLAQMAELEETGYSAPLVAGRFIATELLSEVGQSRIYDTAPEVMKAYPASAFLAHLTAMSKATRGDYRAANESLLEASLAMEGGDGPLDMARQKLIQLSWRVVDLVARENMDWADESLNDIRPADAETPIEDAPQEQLLGDYFGERRIAGHLTQKERMLQGRMRDEYLALCEIELEAAQTLGERIRAIEEMVRTGVRHIPDYTQSYALARQHLTACTPQIEALMTPIFNRSEGQSTVQALCAVIALARKLGQEELFDQVCAHVSALARDPNIPASVMWGVPFTLHRHARMPEVAAALMARLRETSPRSRRDVQNYFRWAMDSHNYEDADAFFASLSDVHQRSHGVLYYVNILQRQSRFEEAYTLLREVHAQVLANPIRTNAYTHYSLIKRTGELRFLRETAEIFTSVPQPTAPKGLILITPRNIDHLRRNPLIVLNDLKRRGWAVIPLVEGLLPHQPTGDPAIDVMIGAIHANTELSRQADAVMEEVTEFTFAPERGHMAWGKLDFSHAVWEDAAINRRRYTIAWHCPELQRYLGGLADWTRSFGRVLDYARDLTERRGLRTGCVSLFSCRMPDALVRSYCAEYGHSNMFFCLHASNGYQNYFTNFSTNVSQRMVVRNVTKHPEVRSGTFPIPANFERYYEANLERLPQIMTRFAPITKVRRSTEGVEGRPPQAIALDARLDAWRARGGKVACAFGKVVCDSGVPHDGGPAHANMKEWLNHTIATVQGTDTLLLIKPHPHELNNQIATFPTEYFEDLIETPLGDNAVMLGHRWFDMDDMRSRIDVGVVYNGTTTIELGLMGIPAILAGHFGPIDYPIGQVTFRDRTEFEAYLRFEKIPRAVGDVQARAAMWLDYMANENFTQPYRFHARPVTNKVLYPPYWVSEDLQNYARGEASSIRVLADRMTGRVDEPGGARWR
ncbi:MAG: hypothetical protein ACU0CI_04150 [Shimia sp.]